MPPGGRRAARPGAVYGNRSDLTGSADAEYGDGVNKETIRQATPDNGGGAAALPGSGPAPGSLIPLEAPTERPGEPVTAGLPVGPGPGPEALAPTPVFNEALFELRALAQRFPYRDLLRVIAATEQDM